MRRKQTRSFPALAEWADTQPASTHETIRAVFSDLAGGQTEEVAARFEREGIEAPPEAMASLAEWITSASVQARDMPWATVLARRADFRQ